MSSFKDVAGSLMRCSDFLFFAAGLGGIFNIFSEIKKKIENVAIIIETSG